MKIKTVVIAGILSAAGMAGLMLAHAQVTATSIQPAPADDIVQLTADEAGLTSMSSAGLPRGATYWVILPGYRGNVNPLPYPCLPVTLTNSPIYDITGNIFLVDATGGQVLTGGNPSGTRATSSTIASVLALQANTVENLILMVQGAAALSTSTTMSANAKPMGQGLSPAFSTQNGPWPYLTIAPTGTNQLLITVINTNPAATYYLQMTPALANSNYPWTIITNGVAGQTNFTVNIGPYANEFFWAFMATNNPGQGVIAVFIDSPANGATVQ
jgi:hypothetical protein